MSKETYYNGAGGRQLQQCFSKFSALVKRKKQEHAYQKAF
jgi:hypothetical protein